MSVRPEVDVGLLPRPGAAKPSRAELRVCHVIHSLREGGAEHVLLSLAEVGVGAGLDLSVLSLMPDEDLRFARRLRELGVPVHSLALGSRWDARGLPRAARLVRTLRPHLLHTHLKHADLVGASVSRSLGLPMVSTLHVIEDAPDPIRRLKRRLAATARLRAANRTITVSDAQRRWYLDTFAADAERVVTVRNGVPAPATVDRGVRAALRTRLGASEQTTLVASVSILRAGKGHEDLLEALSRLPDALDVRLVVAGDGPLRSDLEQRVEHRARLRSRVTFLGFVDDVPTLLDAADIVVQPSHFDALPTALIYALAAGRPAVATTVGGIPEIVGPDAGLLVPPRDVGALAEALETLATDAAARARLGRAAQVRFRGEFEATCWAERLRVVYEEALEEGPR